MGVWQSQAGAVAPVAPAATGPAAPVANGTGEPAKGEASQEATEEGASCWRWLLVIIAMPLLVLITAIGIVLWVGSPPGLCVHMLQNRKASVPW